ncbi:MAG: HRDC domain-containing protein, partial [Acidobacteriales bacterium]|nr:HRDC domain-containing protein [Terriglobales bacterium]
RSPRIFVTGFDRPNLNYAVRRLETEAEKDAALLKFLRSQSGSGIVYCSTRKAVESVAAMLREKLEGRVIAAYHAGFDQNARTRAQQKFISEPNAVAVATNAFGMGINKPETRFVVHYNLPGSLEAYYQEAGRAGRDGAPAHCVLFYNQRDVRTQEFFIRNIGDNNPQLKPADVERLQQQGRLKLEKMHSFAAQWRCRRRQVLEYFGETSAVADCRCDVCAGTGSGLAATQQRSMPVRESYVPPTSEKSRKQAPTIEQLDAPALRRFERLKQARLELAREHKVSAFVIAHDSALRSVAEECPSSLEDLALIRGFGAKKVERFGASFLKALHGEVTPVTKRLPETRQTPHPRPVLAPRPIEHASPQLPTNDPVVSRLLALREQLSREHRLPPYFVLRDSTVQEIARTAPAHLRALSAISGVGEKKAEQFGAAILSVLRGQELSPAAFHEPATKS